MSDSATTTVLDDPPPVSVMTRIVLVILLVLLISMLVGAAFLLRTLVPEVNTDAVIAGERLDKYMSIELPEGFTPIATLDWDLLYVVPMSGVWIEADDGDSVITIVRLEGSMKDDSKVRARAVEALRDQSIGNGSIEKTEPLEAVVAGRERSLKVLHVREPSGERARVVGVDVEVRGEPFLIEIKRPEAQFRDAEIRTILKSIE